MPWCWIVLGGSARPWMKCSLYCSPRPWMKCSLCCSPSPWMKCSLLLTSSLDEMFCIAHLVPGWNVLCVAHLVLGWSVLCIAHLVPGWNVLCCSPRPWMSPRRSVQPPHSLIPRCSPLWTQKNWALQPRLVSKTYFAFLEQTFRFCPKGCTLFVVPFSGFSLERTIDG